MTACGGGNSAPETGGALLSTTRSGIDMTLSTQAADTAPSVAPVVLPTDAQAPDVQATERMDLLVPIVEMTKPAPPPVPATPPDAGAATPTPVVAAVPATPAPAPNSPADPVPAPVKSTLTNTVPAIDTAKIPLGSSGFSTDQLAPTTELPGPSDGTGAFRTVCDFSHMGFDDPIVFPGQPGRSHLHAFFGNTSTDANSTPASIANTGNSTCRGGTVNRTGYWAPAMIDTKDGTPIKPHSLIVYYKTGYTLSPAKIQPLPAGLRMIAGDPTNAAPVSGSPARFTCIDAKTGNGPTTPNIPTSCAVGNVVWMTVIFPQCWDGVNLDSPDHRSHMAYSVGNSCPASHPVAMPEITTNVLYTVTEANSTQRWRLSSDSYDSKLPAGYSSHADWFNGWRPEIMSAFVKNCDQAAKDCHAHLLGNGQKMLGIGVF